jgi:hypothetical protein
MATSTNEYVLSTILNKLNAIENALNINLEADEDKDKDEDEGENPAIYTVSRILSWEPVKDLISHYSSLVANEVDYFVYPLDNTEDLDCDILNNAKLDLELSTVYRLVNLYKENIDILYPLFSDNELDLLIETFVNSMPRGHNTSIRQSVEYAIVFLILALGKIHDHETRLVAPSNQKSKVIVRRLSFVPK